MSNVTPLRRPSSAATSRYLSPEQVCELVPGMSVANLKDLRASGKGPRYSKPTGDRGHITLYREDDVVAWVEAAFVTTREQP
ncbi:helix-turn-helix transcriptional regulator [Microbacterium sp. Root280D1]|uniref:helix-turn-helix transcriptional regulator n=1 Tax=Microbacterium sp. Root280D1 TaxID=1736510 RepID=UPI0006F68F5F|nr:helix-turn-helix domain-containing protein [Microbacterium sp. Root280D1]KRD51933.1 hypothetical protein ASE34_08430 [Microbacterium sp. Root280D1]